jgi:hypothetical protein
LPDAGVAAGIGDEITRICQGRAGVRDDAGGFRPLSPTPFLIKL